MDKALFIQGHTLFGGNFAFCYQSTGVGASPTFPVLMGNKILQDSSLTVTNIHRDQGAMPVFPQFLAEDIAALVTYIRNASAIKFGGVSIVTVEAFLEGSDADGKVAGMRSVWDGVYTKEQAKRGKPVYAKNCTECHGGTPIALGPVGPNQILDEPELGYLLVSDPGASGFASAPLLSGGVFLRGWKGQTVASLYQYARIGMPQGRPGSLTDQQYVDIIAYIFRLNDLPVGEDELLPDTQQLNTIVIEPIASKSSL